MSVIDTVSYLYNIILKRRNGIINAEFYEDITFTCIWNLISSRWNKITSYTKKNKQPFFLFYAFWVNFRIF